MSDDQPTTSASLSPTIIVIFGITGDLAKRYLLPALYHLLKEGLLHPDTQIVGLSRRPLDIGQLYEQVELCVNEIDKTCDPEILRKMRSASRMFQLDPVEAGAYQALRKLLDGIEAERGMCMNRLYYLSIPPQVYGPVIKLMGEAGLNQSCPHGTAITRLLVEKPFGFDENSARQLIADTAAVFDEDQLFRIDHYLAKETVQNILTFRFSNSIFEALWNRRHISRIEICASEQISVAGRAQFYETAGAVRDFIQSHLLQLLAIITMDKPQTLDSQHIHASKQAVLKQVLAVPPDAVSRQTVRAQYEGYQKEVGNPGSSTETFAGIRVTIDSDRWRDVPFIIWTGKALAARRTEIVVTFNSPTARPNQLCFRIQPNEGIELELVTKKPGFGTELEATSMDFSYQQAFAGHEHPNAYERVLVDAVRGDHTLFATSEEVMEAWRIVQPVLDEWSKAAKLTTYTPGADGTELAAAIRD